MIPHVPGSFEAEGSLLVRESFIADAERTLPRIHQHGKGVSFRCIFLFNRMPRRRSVTMALSVTEVMGSPSVVTSDLAIGAKSRYSIDSGYTMFPELLFSHISRSAAAEDALHNSTLWQLVVDLWWSRVVDRSSVELPFDLVRILGKEVPFPVGSIQFFPALGLCRRQFRTHALIRTRQSFRCLFHYRRT